jgi:hypothetical protein
MGWEERNGRYYYYDKVRENGRVVSRYIGKGLASKVIEATNEANRFEREEMREERRRQKALDREIDLTIRGLSAQAKTLTETVLVVSGYHKHKGQWRRKRGQKEHGTIEAAKS